LAFLQWSFGCPSLVGSDCLAIRPSRPAIADSFVNLPHTDRGDVRADWVAFLQQPYTVAVLETTNIASDRNTDQRSAYRSADGGAVNNKTHCSGRNFLANFDAGDIRAE